MRTVVIGGGAAGVAAARTLLDAGADVMLVEASDRLGGRARSFAHPEIGGALEGLHLHDTMGLGLANALAGLEEGVRNFDASLGGLGGCPFAPGASGNIVTEDLVFMLESMGFRTGISLDGLAAARAVLRDGLPGETLHGAVARAGVPRTFGAAA